MFIQRNEFWSKPTQRETGVQGRESKKSYFISNVRKVVVQVNWNKIFVLIPA